MFNIEANTFYNRVKLVLSSDLRHRSHERYTKYRKKKKISVNNQEQNFNDYHCNKKLRNKSEGNEKVMNDFDFSKMVNFVKNLKIRRSLKRLLQDKHQKCRAIENNLIIQKKQKQQVKKYKITPAIHIDIRKKSRKTHDIRKSNDLQQKKQTFSSLFGNYGPNQIPSAFQQQNKWLSANNNKSTYIFSKFKTEDNEGSDKICSHLRINQKALVTPKKNSSFFKTKHKRLYTNTQLFIDGSGQQPPKTQCRPWTPSIKQQELFTNSDNQL